MEKELYFLIDICKFENADYLHFVLDHGSKQTIENILDQRILGNKTLSFSDFKIINLNELIKMMFIRGSEGKEISNKMIEKL